jgi:Mn2+/Fe2+ NRAMP family transporter
MITLIIYVVWTAHPPYGEALQKTILPDKIDAFATVALVGGTVGGYISFAGAHRLLDAGITGRSNLAEVNRGATIGIILTSLIRFMLFLAAFGVIAAGANLDDKNPAASVFQNAAGTIGYKIFGVVMFCAAITSIVGAAYTSVTFLKTFSARIENNERLVIIAFIVVSTLIFLLVGQPARVLVIVGVLNGFILPISLALILLASRKSKIIGDYRHSLWLQISGWFVVLIMLWFCVKAVEGYIK